MKKIILLLISIIYIIISANIAYSLIHCGENDICTRAYKAHYDSKRNIFIIPEDKKNFSINVVFTNSGKVIKFNGKNILYKNGRFAKIGNDYVSYLNGKLYTIGGKKVEIDNLQNIVKKIGNLTPHEYFIGNDFTADDVKNSSDSGGMIYFIPADGTDLGGMFTDVIMYFEGTEVEDGPKYSQNSPSTTDTNTHNNDKNNLFLTKAKIKSIGDKRFQYDSSGKLYKIGEKSVQYNSNGTIRSIGEEHVFYDSNGKLYNIGGKYVRYNSSGRIRSIGDDNFDYDSNGVIRRIGDQQVRYY